MIACGLGNRRGAALSVEVLIVLYLVYVVVENVKEYEEGKITTRMECHKAWELLTSEKLKTS